MKLRKNDKVIVLTGKDKGKTGKVVAVFPQLDKVLVEGLNKVKRHLKVKQGQGGIIEKEAPLFASKVALVDPKTNKPTRLGYSMDKAGAKYRGAKKSGEMRITSEKSKK